MNFFNIIEKILKYICILLFVTLVGVVSFQIFSRILTGKSYAGMEELSIVLLAWASFLSVAYTAKKKAHIKIDYFVDKLFSVKGKKILNVILNLVLIIVFTYLVIISFPFAKRMMRIDMAILPLKKGITFLSFPVGMLFVTVFLFEDLINGIKSLKNDNK